MTSLFIELIDPVALNAEFVGMGLALPPVLSVDPIIRKPFEYNSTAAWCEETRMSKLLLLLFCLSPAVAQTIPEGIGQGYDGELKHVTNQLLALAEATPTDKFAWGPSPGVRSTSEVYMHIATANFYYLSVVGKQTMPTEIKP